MRKSNGFTLIELLAVIIILALLIVLVVPSYTTIYSTVKRQNYQSKVTEINSAAQKYGSTIKDDVKNSEGSCKTITIADLIKKGYIISEDERREIIYNPATAKPMEGAIEICYCRSNFDIESFYAENFDKNTIYHKGDYVRYEGKTYKCLIDTGKGKGSIAGLNEKDNKGNAYFEELSC